MLSYVKAQWQLTRFHLRSWRQPEIADTTTSGTAIFTEKMSQEVERVDRQHSRATVNIAPALLRDKL